VIFLGKGYALLMEMGCGKSLTTIAVAGRAYLNGFINKLLIIAPKSLLEVWKDEFSKFADFPYSLYVLQGSSKKKKKQLELAGGEGLQVVVINYKSVSRLEEVILNWKPDFMVCDESTRIKNPAAKTSWAVHRISKHCKYRMILTGSPIVQNPLDIYSQYKMLDEDVFGTSYKYFKACYGRLNDCSCDISLIILSEFIKKVHSIAYRVTKEHAMNLPEFIDKIQPVTLEDDARELYRDIIEDYEEKEREDYNRGDYNPANILTMLLRLSQITGGFYKDEDEEECELVSTAKLEALENIVEDAAERGEKLVVMARFIPEIKAIEDMLELKGIKYAAVYGEVKDRTVEIKRFQEEPDCRVFIGQLQTAGMGITLNAASTMVFYSLSYSYGDSIQSKARIHRIGQKKTCVYIHLTARNTVDEAILKALQNKENIAKMVVDDWRKIIKQETSSQI
jgi:SNF2 family DNA or RNA helicase